MLACSTSSSLCPLENNLDDLASILEFVILAATAMAIGWSVATYNAHEFARVPGLIVHIAGE